MPPSIAIGYHIIGKPEAYYHGRRRRRGAAPAAARRAPLVADLRRRKVFSMSTAAQTERSLTSERQWRSVLALCSRSTGRGTTRGRRAADRGGCSRACRDATLPRTSAGSPALPRGVPVRRPRVRRLPARVPLRGRGRRGRDPGAAWRRRRRSRRAVGAGTRGGGGACPPMAQTSTDRNVFRCLAHSRASGTGTSAAPEGDASVASHGLDWRTPR